MGAFASVLVRQGISGVLCYRVYTYDTSTQTTGAITIPKSTLFVDWSRSTDRAGATITWTAALGTLTVAALTAGDTGRVIVWYTGG